MSTQALQKVNGAALIQYEPQVDLAEFRLVGEPTLEAIANDVRKFHGLACHGVDAMVLGKFLLGVSLMKARKLVGNARRGVHGGGDGGWMAWKADTFPDVKNNALTDAFNFAELVFEAWQNPKFCTVQNLGIDPISFQLPENREEINGLLGAIHQVLDGKQITSFCRGLGRIRDAVAPGAHSGGGQGKRLSLHEQKEAQMELALKNWQGIEVSFLAYAGKFRDLADEDILAQISVLERQLKARKEWLKAPIGKRDVKANERILTGGN